MIRTLLDPVTAALRRAAACARPGAPGRSGPDARGPAAVARKATAPVLAALLAACASLPPESGALALDRPPLDASRQAIVEQFAAIEAELAADAPWSATRRAVSLRRLPTLTTAESDRLDALLVEATTRAVATARSAGDFEAIDEEDMPRRSRAIFSIGHARALLAEGKYFAAFLRVRDLERVHRTHPLRTQAGDVVFEAGSQLAQDDRKLLWIFPRSSDAPQVLDYLVMQHPSHPRAAEAYLRLAGEYERQGQLRLAIQRYEDLLLYHPGSPGTVEAEARVPQLRLDLQLRDDYDRGELLRARDGLELWLERHGTREGVPADLIAQVREDLRVALVRLTRGDLMTARFYRRVDEPTGQRLHAERALGLARGAGAEELEQEAYRLLLEADTATAAPDLEGTRPIPIGPEPIGPEPAEAVE